MQLVLLVLSQHFYMDKEMIESLENKKVKDWTRLHLKKYRDRNYLIFDKEVLLEAYKQGYLDTLIYCGQRPFDFKKSYEVSRVVLNKISKRDDLDYIGVGKEIEEKRAYCSRIMMLDELSDPLNIGRIMECAYLFGFDTILLSENCADIYHPKCLSASKGAIYHLNIFRGNLVEQIKDLKEKGYIIYATGLKENSLFLDEVNKSPKMAFVLGNEGSGVSKEVFDSADETVKIQMNNIDSLNVAMAGSIIMYRFLV